MKSKKTEQKEKAQIIEDKTFGLKNKNRSTKVGKYVEQVKQQVQTGGSRKAQKEEQAKELSRKQRKEDEERRKAEEALLAKPIIVQPKIPFGVDPKSVLCAAFKAGQCTKGDKCKYSHDLAVDRKSTKIDLYSDTRHDQKEDTMETWDQSTLESCISKKHNNMPPTDIVCKYFLDAIETRKYGWFWACPNGGDACKYRHALPPGYVLKSTKEERPDDDEEQISFEEFIETERHNLTTCTPLTADTFLQWKDARKRKLQDESEKKQKDKKHFSGRDIFTAQPEICTLDDADAFEADVLATREHDFYDDKDGITTMVEEPFDEDLFIKENLADLGLEE